MTMTHVTSPVVDAASAPTFVSTLTTFVVEPCSLGVQGVVWRYRARTVSVVYGAAVAETHAGYKELKDGRAQPHTLATPPSHQRQATVSSAQPLVTSHASYHVPCRSHPPPARHGSLAACASPRNVVRHTTPAAEGQAPRALGPGACRCLSPPLRRIGGLRPRRLHIGTSLDDRPHPPPAPRPRKGAELSI
ncbi:hypothetical protein CC85DRAFT_136946 [Cutaneotrichosporon oleaginosum]|uniref:Uncharacterized protein n=1 Tax=Cutaneotrichosporon oleaginosum TaxID=879819 RepID=A0A0J0XWW6_9TREE|nr:uncharacterized protein CC85DRAFT_136946 [Cutaneotrichosporon oleaginosum]KLT45541.1 hypothetical protein CC85DRAFT_136946 [Cutaneotrichosporon oleaginosum]TXT14505.1 hypothetical protein COLE_00698 [Cutaneotrichosporon oleaginosum]